MAGVPVHARSRMGEDGGLFVGQSRRRGAHVFELRDALRAECIFGFLEGRDVYGEVGDVIP